jgi:tetratricopeptide (TPR) repeat protein
MSIITSNSEAQSLCDKYLAHARKLQKEKKYKESEAFLTAALQKCGKDVRFYYYRAELRGEYLGRKIEALNDYTAAIKINYKFYPKAFWRRGRIYYSLGMYNQSIQDYNNCLKLMPNYNRVYYMRGLSYGKIGERQKAIKDIKYAIKLTPKFRFQGEPIIKKIMAGRTDY